MAKVAMESVALTQNYDIFVKFIRFIGQDIPNWKQKWFCITFLFFHLSNFALRTCYRKIDYEIIKKSSKNSVEKNDRGYNAPFYCSKNFRKAKLSDPWSVVTKTNAQKQIFAKNLPNDFGKIKILLEVAKSTKSHPNK